MFGRNGGNQSNVGFIISGNAAKGRPHRLTIFTCPLMDGFIKIDPQILPIL